MIKKVNKILEEQGIREKVKVMIVIGVVMREFAEKIDAGGYEKKPTEPGETKIVKNLVCIA